MKTRIEWLEELLIAVEYFDFHYDLHEPPQTQRVENLGDVQFSQACLARMLEDFRREHPKEALSAAPA